MDLLAIQGSKLSRRLNLLVLPLVSLGQKLHHAKNKLQALIYSSNITLLNKQFLMLKQFRRKTRA